jgi:hypothetical protein
MSPPTLPELGGRREEILATARARGASRVRVVGSVARGEAEDGSDVDFLVDLEPGRNLMDLGGLLMDLYGSHRRPGRCGDHPCVAGSLGVPEGMVVIVSKTRAERAGALESWADKADSDELVTADTDALKVIAELAERRNEVDAALLEAVRSARAAHRSWSEIGAMLGVSKQAAQRKYARRTAA